MNNKYRLKYCFVVFQLVLFLLIPYYSLVAQKISPYLLGQNYWLEDGDEGRVGYIHKLWNKVERSGVRIIRIGGNGYQNNFPERDRLNNMIDSIKAIGAEPLLQISSTFSDVQVKEVVRYYTRDDHRKVNYWSIGNEPLLHERHSLDQVHQFVIRIARAMKSENPDIRVFVFDEASLREEAYSALIGGERDITGLKENGAWLIDGVSFHNYPMGAEFERDDVIFYGPDKILKQILRLKELIGAANKKHNRTGREALLWGLTEFNVTYANPNREISGYGNPSFLGGQFMAEIFGFGMKYNAFMMNPWCISETDVVRTDFGYIGMPVEFYPRSTWYHMKMLSDHMRENYLDSSNDQDYVKTIAMDDNTGITIMIMNQHQTEGYDFTINSSGSNASSKLGVSISVSTSLIKEYQGRLKAQSTKLLAFDNNGTLIKEIDYSLNDNLKHHPPVTSATVD